MLSRKNKFLILSITLFLYFCSNQKVKEESIINCIYPSTHNITGNAYLNIIEKDGRLYDPIDDTLSFKKIKYDLLTKDGEIFKT